MDPNPFRYLEPLAIALDQAKWSLVQLLMSSSHTGFGTSSLRQPSTYNLFGSPFGVHKVTNYAAFTYKNLKGCNGNRSVDQSFY
ncbi:uncharacterized protein LOC107423264 isoform X10 [Ziziphus jujuba]|uniref:Uncharacterized protein LOC107423264 isoform X10 n=1 Tax=Ziziphus jujuba TaxID=326968 RepID=A0ABM4A5F6_ZIZJJ|nr:uncharacterized protein LOC107423264 isoform X10 [Ziziphus jujuba]